MNKKLEMLRTAQKNELREAIAKVAQYDTDIENMMKELKNLPAGPERMKRYNEAIAPLNKEREILSQRVEFLTLETCEKKYANELLYSDVNPYEVIEEKTENCMVIRSMNAVEKPEARDERIESFVPGGFVGHFDNDLQEWDITPDPNGYVLVIRRHKNGLWYTPGGTKFEISTAPCKFYDFNF